MNAIHSVVETNIFQQWQSGYLDSVDYFLVKTSRNWAFVCMDREIFDFKFLVLAYVFCLLADHAMN